MSKPTIFLSHFTHEAKVASALKDFIYSKFGHAVDVFLSSERDSIQLGALWEQKIRQGLRNAKICISLLSEDALSRPWINFEAGAAWFHSATVIPLLHRNLTISSLPHPFRSFEATNATTKQGIHDLVKRIEQKFDLLATLGADDCQNLANIIVELGHEIDAQEPHYPLISNVTFSLYGKSHAQQLANAVDTGGAPVFNFRKPNLSKVFKALKETGQVYTRIVSIDEYWVGYLAQLGRLEKLTGRNVLKSIYSELLPSCMFHGDYWSVPHFMDFSYYSVLKGVESSAIQHLRGLIANDHYAENLDALQKLTNSQNVLCYDIKTPDTAACVILEFLFSAGNGADSFKDKSRFTNERNVFALKLLKDLVGPRDSIAFTLAEPLNLDEVCRQTVFLRHWHSMATDELECRRTHAAVIDFPIMGTLGGWHLGILSNAPFPQEGSHALEGFLLPDCQQRRFVNGGGLPVLAEFYHGPNSSLRDVNTQWSLLQINDYVRRLLRRSHINNFDTLRDLFWQLHIDLMTNTNPNYEQLLSQCADGFFVGGNVH